MFHRAEVAPLEFKGRAKELLGWASFVNSYDPELGGKYLFLARGLRDHS
jgi:hypothetical protein